MSVSQKCQYALRAVFELAKHQGTAPVRVADIARAQAIPSRFLQLILGQLRQAGCVESRRGVRGGYLLAKAPASLTVGEVIRLIDGPVAPVDCLFESKRPSRCPLHGSCVFMGLWERAHEAVSEVYDTTTFQDLLDDERAATEAHIADYCI